MSTITEHLVELEFHAANGYADNFTNSAFLFIQVHSRELLAAVSADELIVARHDLENRLREQHGDAATTHINKWQNSIAAPQVALIDKTKTVIEKLQGDQFKYNGRNYKITLVD